MTREEHRKIVNAVIDAHKDNEMGGKYAKAFNHGVDSAFNRVCKALEYIKKQSSESTFERIRTEILDEAEYAYADFDRYKEDILHAEPDELPDDDFRYGLERAVEIINKYREGGARMSGGEEDDKL